MGSDQEKSGQVNTIRRSVEPSEVKPTTHRPPTPTREKPEAVPPPVPPGRRGEDIKPTTDPTNPAQTTDRQPPATLTPDPSRDPVVFETDTPLGAITSSRDPVEPCGGSSEAAVMMSGTLWALYSPNAGTSFVDVPLGSAFDMTASPGVRGLPAGDQIIHYVPKIDRFIWLLLYYPDKVSGLNAFGLAAAKPIDLAASKGRKGWYRWDITSTTLGLGTDFMDFPDIAFTDDFLYISVLGAKGGLVTGFLVARIPLSQLVSSQAIDIEMTDFAKRDKLKFRGRLVQNARGQAIWAGHVDTDTLRVYNWPDGSGVQPPPRDIAVDKWYQPPATIPPIPPIPIISMTPPIPANNPANRVAVNWLGNEDSGVKAGVQRRDEVILGWTSDHGGAFAHPHVRLVTLDTNTWTVTRESQIWNPDHAWACPWLALNALEEVGMAIGWGGGGIHFGSTAFGIPEDHVLWYSEPSDTAISRWGDYVTARSSAHNRSLFDGFGYTLRYDAATDAPRGNPRYTRFGRQSAVV